MPNDIINYLKKTLKIIKNNKILFKYTYETASLNKNITSSIFDSDFETFRLSYNNIEYIGIGRCKEYVLNSKKDLEKLNKIKLNIKSFGDDKNKELKIFGGVAFNINNKLNKPWDKIPVGLFVIPKLLITKKNKRYYITYHCLLDKNSNLENMINDYDSIINYNNNIKNKINLKYEKDYPSKLEYQKAFNILNDKINSGFIDKVVLSRMKIYSTSNKNRLIRDQSNCTNFHFDLTKNERFMGSTPEKIIEVINKKLYTNAIAGTLRKNQDNMDLDDFLINQKELSEHQYVIKDLINKLKKFSDNITYSNKPSILELKHLYHLNTPIKGMMNNKYHILEILYHLYPTPAVLGTPHNKALDLILNNEPFDRGWYGGCIGWFDLKGNGKFDVTIRSGLQRNNKLYLYAGSGLVNGSSKEYEWDETHEKFKHLISLIN